MSSFIYSLLSISLLVFLVTRGCFAQPDAGSDKVDIKCVSLKDCPDIAYLVKNYNKERVFEILKVSTCGYDNDFYPKVWCPIVISPAGCVTPDQKPGKCKPLQDCEAFRKWNEAPDRLTNQMKILLYKHKCDDPDNPRGFSVCCPKNVGETTIKTPPVITSTHLIPRPSEGECGQQLLNKIVGGKVTELDEYPWTVLLAYDDGSDINIGCGGSLISSRYVVTAAHCVDNSAIRHSGELAYVILGEYDTQNATDCVDKQGYRECADPPIEMGIEKIILHPQWYSKPSATVNHDIALLRLAKPVTFTDYVKPICLPSSNLVLQEKQKLEVVGWGQTEKGRVSNVKLKTDLPLFNRNQCVSKYKQEKRLNIGDGQICAGGEEGKDSCSGDSGGPLMLSVQRPEYSAWFLAGVVSFGPNQPCGVKNYPGLYTYIPKYVEWIQENIAP